MAKAILFFAPGLEECEGLVTLDVLRRAGIDARTVSITDDRAVTGAHGVTVLCDALARETDLSAADAVILPGGMPGTRNLAECGLVTRTVLEYAAAGKRVAAICAAPSVLGGLGLLKGKRATAYPGFEAELHGAAVTQDEVVTDGCVTTARGLGAAIPFGLELVRLLAGEETAARVRGEIVYRL